MQASGVDEAAKPGTLVPIHSTVLPRTLKAIVEKAAAKDIIVVDAPISGGQTGVLADH
jgi:3-hydroxyisobutyrate dehydrogenase-like beta-hydroxyacid dehydrogenase